MGDQNFNYDKNQQSTSISADKSGGAKGKGAKKERRQSLINPTGLIAQQGGSSDLSQWSRDDIQHWLDLIKVPKAKEPFENFTGVELSQMREKCHANSSQFGRYLRETFQLDLYSQKQL